MGIGIVIVVLSVWTPEVVVPVLARGVLWRLSDRLSIAPAHPRTE